jgi:hypothetical protein
LLYFSSYKGVKILNERKGVKHVQKRRNSAGELMHKKFPFPAKADECDTYSGRPGQPGFPERNIFFQIERIGKPKRD